MSSELVVQLELMAALAKIKQNAEKGQNITRFYNMSKTVRLLLEASGCPVKYRLLWTTVDFRDMDM